MKWYSKAKKVMFVGFDKESENYILWNPTKEKIEVSGNVYFIKKESLTNASEETKQ